MEVFILSFIIILLICSFVLYLCFKKLCKLTTSIIKEEISKLNLTDECYDKEQLTSYELERLKREEEFDNRINRLKEEIAEQQIIIRKGTSADELHPLVHNLPHDIIEKKYDVHYGEEVAE